MSGCRVFVMILAAGQGKRMGRMKQLLPYRETCMVDAVIDAVLESPIEGLVLVANAQIADRFEECLPDRCFVEVNDDPDSEMITSVKCGFARLRAECDLAPRDGIMVLLADQPQITGGTIATCAETYRLPKKPPGILIATYGGRGGHPTIFSCELIEEVLGWPENRRLSELAQMHPESVRRLPITSCSMPIDVNTPDDYERLKRSW